MENNWEYQLFREEIKRLEEERKRLGPAYEKMIEEEIELLKQALMMLDADSST